MPNIALKVKVVDTCEILHKALAHAIKRDLVDEAVIDDQTDDPIPNLFPCRSMSIPRQFRGHFRAILTIFCLQIERLLAASPTSATS